MVTQTDEKTARIVKFYSDKNNAITAKYYELVKWIGTSSLAFLPFFVALIPRNPLHGLLLGLYITVVASIGLGLCSACALLFGQLRTENLLLIQATKALAEPSVDSNTHDISQVSYPTYYRFSKKIFGFSYIIFFISFIAFCILIVFTDTVVKCSTCGLPCGQ